MLTLMLGSQARARSRASISGRDQGMGARADRLPHRVCACVAGVSLVWTRIVFRPFGIALQGRSAGAGARSRRADRRGHVAAVSQRQVVCRAHRARLAEHRHLARSARTPSRSLRRSYWAVRTPSSAHLTLNDLPAGKLAIRDGLVTVQNWNPALPQLELRGVDVDLRRGADLAALEVERAVAGGAWAARCLSTARPAVADRSQPSIGTFSRAPAACRSPAGGSCCPNI